LPAAHGCGGKTTPVIEGFAPRYACSSPLPPANGAGLVQATT
jgi:hypothetical protein